MVIKRILSIIFDFLSAFFPALGCQFAGLDFFYAFICFYLIEQIIGIFYFKGRTVGMVLFKMQPKNSDGNYSSIFKILIYQMVFSMIILNIFNTMGNIYSNILLTIVLITPISIKMKVQSLMDLFFGLHWTKE